MNRAVQCALNRPRCICGERQAACEEGLQGTAGREDVGGGSSGRLTVWALW